MHKCGFQPALPSQLGKKRLHGMCGQFLSRLSELTRQATAAVPARRDNSLGKRRVEEIGLNFVGMLHLL
jgi:hypothetical protein